MCLVIDDLTAPQDILVNSEDIQKTTLFFQGGGKDSISVASKNRDFYQCFENIWLCFGKKWQLSTLDPYVFHFAGGWRIRANIKDTTQNKITKSPFPFSELRNIHQDYPYFS